MSNLPVKNVIVNAFQSVSSLSCHWVCQCIF